MPNDTVAPPAPVIPATPALHPSMVGHGETLSPEMLASHVGAMRRAGFSEESVAAFSGTAKAPPVEVRNHIRAGTDVPAPPANGDYSQHGVINAPKEMIDSFVAAGVPAIQARVLDSELHEASNTWNDLPVEQEGHYLLQQQSILSSLARHVGGVERAIALSDATLARFGAEYRGALVNSGALRSAKSIMQLAMIALAHEQRGAK